MQSLRRARILAFFLDLALAAGLADAAAFAASAIVWVWKREWVSALPWIWRGAALAGVLAFLLRDASGGRARRWLALEVRDGAGKPPGASASIRRNLPLLVPVWNLIEAWPVLRRGEAQRVADRKRGLQVVSTT